MLSISYNRFSNITCDEISLNIYSEQYVKYLCHKFPGKCRSYGKMTAKALSHGKNISLKTFEVVQGMMVKSIVDIV